MSAAQGGALGLPSLAAKPTSKVLITAHADYEAAAAAFGGAMAVVGLEAAPETLPALEGREVVYVGAHGYLDAYGRLGAGTRWVATDVTFAELRARHGAELAAWCRDNAVAAPMSRPQEKPTARPAPKPEHAKHNGTSEPHLAVVTDIAVARDAKADEARKKADERKRKAQEKLTAMEAAGLMPWKGKVWAANLIYSMNGFPKALHTNVAAILRLDPVWRGCFAYDVFAHRVVLRKDSPTNVKGGTLWADHHDMGVLEWVQRNGVHAKDSDVRKAIDTIAHENEVNPVLEYLAGLTHDGTKRAERWLIDFCGAPDTAYVRTVGLCFLVGAVRRVKQPGVKHDCALVLEGPQGKGKSTAFSILGGEFFTDDLGQVGSKEAKEELQGAWIIELAELASVGRAEVEAVRAFLSRKKDRFRVAYGHRVEEFPRTAVFGGTINPGGGGYLKDHTGGRRFWPVEAGDIDLVGLVKYRDQFWAEAVALEAAGVPHWIADKDVQAEAAAVQESRREVDAWEDEIARYLELRPGNDTAVGEILENCFKLEPGDWKQPDQNRVAKCLHTLGWEKYQRRDGERKGNKRSNRYRKIVSPLLEVVNTIEIVSTDQKTSIESRRSILSPLSPLSFGNVGTVENSDDDVPF